MLPGLVSQNDVTGADMNPSMEIPEQAKLPSMESFVELLSLVILADMQNCQIIPSKKLYKLERKNVSLQIVQKKKSQRVVKSCDGPKHKKRPSQKNQLERSYSGCMKTE